MTNLDSVLKSRDVTLPIKVHVAKAMIFPVVLFGWESWTIKKTWCFWALWCWRRLLRVPWTARRWSQSILKEINPKYSLEGLMLSEALILLQPNAKSWHIGKDPDAGKDWGQEEKGMTEDEMIGWHHWLSGHEFEQAWVDGERQRSLVCCSPWDHKGSDMTERLNNNSSAGKLNKQGIRQYTVLTCSFPNLEPVCFSMASFNCCLLICIQISQEAGQVVWYSHHFKNFHSLLWSTQSKALA